MNMKILIYFIFITNRTDFVKVDHFDTYPRFIVKTAPDYEELF